MYRTIMQSLLTSTSDHRLGVRKTVPTENRSARTNRKIMNIFRILPFVALLTLLLGACATTAPQCPAGTQALPGCPPEDAVDDEGVNRPYELRTWHPARDLTIDPVKMGEEAEVPINEARAKLLGPTPEDGLNSLAVKLWLIENAEQTIDAMYYIFANDTVGQAVLGAMCNAVKRGVDVRIMVDSLGSFDPVHVDLKALETCANDAGFMRNAQGQIATKRARVQAVIFNALTNFQFNRRSHDKLLIVDANIPAKAAVITGGRNISLDYYGIKEDGSPDPSAFRDLEILLRPQPDQAAETLTVSSVTEIYYTLLFLHKGNRRLRPGTYDRGQADPYPSQLNRCQKSLTFLKSLPQIRERLDAMPGYMSQGFRNAEVRIAHQLGNLTSTEVTTNVEENVKKNPNSILYLLEKMREQAKQQGNAEGTLRIVSPYLFSGKYYDKYGKVVYDGAQNTLEYLRENPDVRLEVITNSVLTSDNFFTQAIIDMGMAPRFLLTPELMKAWQSSLEKGEFNPAVVDSDEWKHLIDHPQIFIYQTGKLDSVLLGHGTAHYGKLHAKFILGETGGFIGTSNFDYRSNLWNNEMGFFFRSPELRQDLLAIFEQLQASSYRWGTPEWLEMRKELMASDSKKAGPARRQRGIYKTLRATGLEYLM